MPDYPVELPPPYATTVADGQTVLSLAHVPPAYRAQALAEGLEAIDYDQYFAADVPTLEELERLRRSWSIQEILQAEAGTSLYSAAETLAFASYELRTGPKLLLCLMLLRHDGERLAWQLSIDPAGNPGPNCLWFGRLTAAEAAMSLMFSAAGGFVEGSYQASEIEIPTEDELAKLGG